MSKHAVEPGGTHEAPPDADALFARGVVAFDAADYGVALRSFEAAHELYRAVKAALHSADCLKNIGVVHRVLGDHATAERCLRRALTELADVPESDFDRAECWLNLANSLRERGSFDEAGSSAQRALELFAAPVGTAVDRADCALALAHIHADLGERARARSLYRGALEVYEQTSSADSALDLRLRAAHCRMAIGLLRHEDGDASGAVRAYRTALAGIGAAPHARLLRGQCESNLGTALAQLGRSAEAEKMYLQAEETFRALDLRGELHILEHNLALLKETVSGEATDASSRSLREEALALAIASTFDADARRNRLATEADRARWARRMGSRKALAFRLARDLGDAATIADLIAVARAGGALVVSASDGRDGYQMIDHRDRPVPPPSGERPAFGAGTVSDVGLDDLFRRSPLPSLIMPGGRVALGPRVPSSERSVRYA